MFQWVNTWDHLHTAKVLVLTGSLGHGHIQTANAIKETIQQRYGRRADVQIVDYLELTSPHLHNVGSYCYVQWVKHFPSMYGGLFELTRKERKFAQAIKSIRLSSLRKLTKLIQEMEPTIVVSTFPAASAAVSKLRERGIIQCAAATIITDHTDHSFWIHPYTDLYMVASEQAKEMLIEQGIAPNRITVTGIPLRPAFYKKYDKYALREQYHLQPNKLTVLIMGGGCGLLDPAVLESLEEAPWARNIQIIVICGNNERLQHHLEHWAAQVSLDVVVRGYTQNIHEYMAMSDLMITKSGGVTISEAIAQRLPLLVFKPLPGQEQDNIDYLLRTGLACSARNVNSLLGHLANFAKQPQQLEMMRRNAEAICSPIERDAIDVLMELERMPAPLIRTSPSWFKRPVG